MKGLTKEQRETLALMDAILSMTEKTPKEYNSMKVETNPIDLLISILGKFVTYDEIVEWLSKMLVYVLPEVELGIKGVLLAQLKKTIDCNNDPRIPNKFRKCIYNFSEDGNYGEDCKERGILLNINAIDSMGILKVSPLSGRGYLHYFGTKSYYAIAGEDEDEQYHVYMDAVTACRKKGKSRYDIIDKSEINNVYELARAEDFNAFLWFIIHKAKFTYPKMIDGSASDYFKNNGAPIMNVNEDVKNILVAFDGEINLSKDLPNPPYMPGDILVQRYTNLDGVRRDGTLCSLCLNMNKTKSKSNSLLFDENTIQKENGEVTKPDPIVDTNLAPDSVAACADLGSCRMSFVPVSSDNFSANWYVDRDRYFDFLTPNKTKNKPRNYSKEFAICNLEYVPDERIRFTILPKPLIHLPHPKEKFTKVFKIILFDCNGNPDKKGKFSVHPKDNMNIVKKMKFSNGEYVECNGDEKPQYHAYKLELNFHVLIDVNDGTYFLIDNNNKKVGDDGFDEVGLTCILYECYKGLTVYEFNYDFIMGIKLFDPVVVAARLITMVTNMRFGTMSFGFDKYETEYTMGLRKAIANMISADAYEVSDCFYSFDNSEYDSMMRESELKRAKLYPFNKNGKNEGKNSNDGKEIEEILNHYDKNATLNKNQDVIKRAINQATASITNEVLPEDKYEWKFNIVTSMMRDYIVIIVESVLSPKIMAILEINRQLYGEGDEKIDIRELLKGVEGIIVALVAEIRDLILKELLDWVRKLLFDLLGKLSKMLIQEKIEFYSTLIRQMIKACTFKVKHRKPLENELDYVDYADIDAIDRPLESNC